MNLRHGAGDVRQLPMEQAVTFMELIRSAGKQEMRLLVRCYHVNGYHQRNSRKVNQENQEELKL